MLVGNCSILLSCLGKRKCIVVWTGIFCVKLIHVFNFIEVERLWPLRYRFPAHYHPILRHFEVYIVLIFTLLGKPFLKVRDFMIFLSTESNYYLEYHLNIGYQSVNLWELVSAMTKSDFIRIFSWIKVFLTFLVFCYICNYLLLPKGEIRKCTEKGSAQKFSVSSPKNSMSNNWPFLLSRSNEISISCCTKISWHLKPTLAFNKVASIWVKLHEHTLYLPR